MLIPKRVTVKLNAEAGVPPYKEESRECTYTYTVLREARGTMRKYCFGYHQLCYVDQNMELGQKEKKWDEERFLWEQLDTSWFIARFSAGSRKELRARLWEFQIRWFKHLAVVGKSLASRMFCNINLKESESHDAAVTVWAFIQEEDCSVRISSWSAGILTKIFHGFSQSNSCFCYS